MEDMRLGTCPLCKHNKIIRSWPKDLGEANRDHLMAVAIERSWMTGVKPIGALYLCTCQRCGYAQWFVFEPEKVPIDDKYDTSIVTGPEHVGPYR